MLIKFFKSYSFCKVIIMASGLLDLTVEDLKLKNPCGIFMAGASQSGKSTFTKKVVYYANELFKNPPKSFLYAHGRHDDFNQTVYDFQQLGCITQEGPPDFAELNNYEKPLLLILDDLRREIKEEYLSELFTKRVHHNNLIVLYLTQAIYDKKSLVARINSQYMVLMRNKMFAHQITILGTQLFPTRRAFFLDAYKKATKEVYGSLLIDNHPSSPEALQLRSQIMPDEEPIFYIMQT
jgi:hypothetical protein